MAPWAEMFSMQAQPPEISKFHGRKREPTPKSCSLALTMCRMVDSQAHIPRTNNCSKLIFKNKNFRFE